MSSQLAARLLCVCTAVGLLLVCSGAVDSHRTIIYDFGGGNAIAIEESRDWDPDGRKYKYIISICCDSVYVVKDDPVLYFSQSESLAQLPRFESADPHVFGIYSHSVYGGLENIVFCDATTGLTSPLSRSHIDYSSYVQNHRIYLRLRRAGLIPAHDAWEHSVNELIANGEIVP